MADVTTVSTSTPDVPTFLQPYVTSNLQNMQNLTDPNANPYAGQASYYAETGLTPDAEVNPLETQAAMESQKLGPSAQIGQASDLAANAGLASLNAGANYNAMAMDPAAMQKWMSPYMQSVVDQQKQGAIRDYARQLPSLGFGGARAGGLGGSRSALVQAEGQRNLGNRLGDIQASGLQSAWGDANKNMQYGADLGMKGYGQALQGASTLGDLGAKDFGQQLSSIQNRSTVGAGLRGIDTANKAGRFTDYQAMRNDPLKKAQAMGTAISGVPIQNRQASGPGSSSVSGDISAGVTSIAAIGKALGWW